MKAADYPSWLSRSDGRLKLNYSQKVFEGICVEDYRLIATNAGKLRAMTDAFGFEPIKTSEYAIRTASFRRKVEALQKAAMEKRLDALVSAYHEVTSNCVECH
jgi:hypothetical protein